MCLLMFAHLDAVCYCLSCFSFIRNGQDDFIVSLKWYEAEQISQKDVFETKLI